MQNNLSSEQEADIKTRIEAAEKYLKENGLEVAAQTLTPNLGNLDPKLNNIFGFMVHPYLKDIKFLGETPIASPLQANDLNSPKA